eukprot:TRINITY_DN7102_c0_g1_i8.p1 TRINITY_DN7102_c0_g1~~TRINITY_DN7102_c0_g1_i8.p1  ORF type:complete len:313 (+),score=70.06 TRINITY_DN7102_c0_g1_i8:64-1002(+)
MPITYRNADGSITETGTSPFNASTLGPAFGIDPASLTIRTHTADGTKGMLVNLLSAADGNTYVVYGNPLPAPNQEPSVLNQSKLIRSTVRISIDGEETGSGIILGGKENQVIVTCLHNFEGEKSGLPEIGFPEGFSKEFKDYADSLKNPHGPPKKRKKDEKSVDPIKLRIEVVSDYESTNPSTFVPIFEGALVKQHIVGVNGKLDVIVLKLELKVGVDSYPVDFDPHRGQQIQLIGFTTLFEYKIHIIPGHITSVGFKTILVNALSAHGMSGGALVCSKTGSALGIIGGAGNHSDQRFVTYCAPISIAFDAL